MKRRFTTWALAFAVVLCGLLSAVTFRYSVADESETNNIVVTRVSETNAYPTDEQWESLASHAMTGHNTGNVKLALMGNYLYFRAEIHDETKSPATDYFYYNISAGGKSEIFEAHCGGAAGNFWGRWTATEFGSKDGNDMKQEYDDEGQNYVIVSRTNLAAECYEGSAVKIVIRECDVETWGTGLTTNATVFSSDVYLLKGPAPVISSSFANATSGTEYVTLPAEGDAHNTIAMGGKSSSVSGANMPEATLNLEEGMSEEKNVRVTTTVTLVTDEEDAADYRTIGISIAEGTSFVLRWDDKTDAYVAGVNVQGTLGKDHALLTKDLPAWLTIQALERGVSFKVERAGHNLSLYALNGKDWELLASSTCHAEETTAVVLRAAYCGWEFTDTAVETFQPEQTPAPDPAEMTVKQLQKASGKVSDAEWETLPKHIINENNNGFVQFAGVSTTVWVRLVVEDVTYHGDRDAINVTLNCGDEASQAVKFTMNGKAWTVDQLCANVQVKDVQFTSIYTAAKCSYDMQVGIDIGDKYVDGASLSAKVTYRDGSDKFTTGAALDSGTATTFEGTLSLIGAPNMPEPDPVNEDLHIVVVDLAKQPTEKDWQNATAYPLIKVSGATSGATGTVKIFTCAKNIYYRLEITDPTTNNQNDGLYIFLGLDEGPDGNPYRYEARGNYTQPWLTSVFSDGDHNDLKVGPNPCEVATTALDAKGYVPGVYTLTIGMDIKNIYGEGNTMRLELRHRDSQSSAEAWKDGDYWHTIYFNQTITFGEPADTTVRPQTPTEGFVGATGKIDYNKASFTWEQVDGANDGYSYYLYLYKKGAEGDTEPWIHVKTEGPVYADYSTYNEQITGLAATTDYAVQIFALDDEGEVVARSNLIEFSTISAAASIDPGTNPGTDPGTDPGTNPETPSNGDKTEKGGCGSNAIATWLPVSLVLVLSGFVLALRKKNRG